MRDLNISCINQGGQRRGSSTVTTFLQNVFHESDLS